MTYPINANLSPSEISRALYAKVLKIEDMIRDGAPHYCICWLRNTNHKTQPVILSHPFVNATPYKYIFAKIHSQSVALSKKKYGKIISRYKRGNRLNPVGLQAARTKTGQKVQLKSIQHQPRRIVPVHPIYRTTATTETPSLLRPKKKFAATDWRRIRSNRALDSARAPRQSVLVEFSSTACSRHDYNGSCSHFLSISLSYMYNCVLFVCLLHLHVYIYIF